MAKVGAPLFSNSASGMLADLLVYTKTANGHRCYKNTPPVGTGNANRKQYYADGCAAWQLLDVPTKEGWRDLAVPLKITGFNLFMQDWMNTYTPPATFVPTDLTGNKIWLDGTDPATITSTLTKVSAWADKSGNGYDAVQLTELARPTYNEAGGYIEFDGVQQFFGIGQSLTTLGLKVGALAGPFTIMARAWLTSNLKSRIFSSAGVSILHGGDATGKLSLYLYSSSSPTNRISKLSDASLTEGAWINIGMTHDGGTSANNIKLYVGATEVPATPNPLGSYTNVTEQTIQYIGKSQVGGDSFLSGRIKSFVLYDNQLNAADIATLDTYMNTL